jgi:hypothetical protein
LCGDVSWEVLRKAGTKQWGCGDSVGVHECHRPVYHDSRVVIWEDVRVFIIEKERDRGSCASGAKRVV